MEMLSVRLVAPIILSPGRLLASGFNSGNNLPESRYFLSIR